MASWFSRKDFLLAGLKAERVELDGNTIRVHCRSAKSAAACPRCGTISRHVHSRYRRSPADLPAHGRKVELILLVRRFRCRALPCPTGIFAERFPPAVTRPHARRTSRLQGLVRHLGLAPRGITFCEWRRDWDSAIWPHATAGFFKVKRQIPRFRSSMELA